MIKDGKEVKTITMRITEEQHREIKVQASKRGLSIKDYILTLVSKDTDKKLI